MTKAEIIDTIKKEEEKAWEEANEFERLLGVDNAITIAKVTYWSALFDLKRSLGL